MLQLAEVISVDEAFVYTMRLVREVVQLPGTRPFHLTDGYSWTEAPARDGRIARLHVCANGEQLCYSVEAGIAFRRAAIPPRLAVFLLELNDKVSLGSFRFRESERQLRLVLAFLCHTRGFPIAALRNVGEMLIANMQEAVHVLTGEGLISHQATETNDD